MRFFRRYLPSVVFPIPHILQDYFLTSLFKINFILFFLLANIVAPPADVILVDSSLELSSFIQAEVFCFALYILFIITTVSHIAIYNYFDWNFIAPRLLPSCRLEFSRYLVQVLGIILS